MSMNITHHPDYDTRSRRWEKIRAHMDSTEVIDNLRNFVHRWEQGESVGEYEYRLRIGKYVPHFAFAVNALSGQLFQAEAQQKEYWGEEGVETALGNPSDQGSVLNRVWHDVDGAGTNWQVLWRQLAPALIGYRDYWILPEGPVGDRDIPTVSLIHPLSVVDWRYEGTRLVEALVKERVDLRTRIGEDSEIVDQYVHYHLEGWSRLDEGGEEIGSGTYAYYSDRNRSLRILPLARLSVPIKQDLGYVMCRVAETLLNQSTMLDVLLVIANKPRQVFESRAAFEEGKELLSEGMNAMWGDFKYVSPPSDPIITAGERLAADLEDFYKTFFQSYADEARQVTATQILQEAARGPEAYLTLLAAAVAEGQSHTLKIWEQAMAPNSPEKWGHAWVEAATSFKPFDAGEAAQGLLDRYITSRAPIGQTARQNVIQRVLELDGIPFDTDEMNEELEEFTATPENRVGGLLTRGERSESARTLQELERRAAVARGRNSRSSVQEPELV